MMLVYQRVVFDIFPVMLESVFHEVTHAVKGLADQMDVLEACRSGRCPSNKNQKQLLQYITIQQYCNIL